MNTRTVEAALAANRGVEERLDQGEANERALLRKETQRLMKESADFEQSKAQINMRLVKIASGIAGASVVLNLVLGVALAAMAPLKEVEPYLLRVDTSTGYVDVARPLDESPEKLGALVDSHFIKQYILAREGYDWMLAQRNFNTVAAYSFTNTSTFNEYANFMKSPQSPVAVLADKARVAVDVTAPIVDEKTNTATIRFTKTVLGQDGRPSPTIPRTHWIATLSYEYPQEKLTPEQRELNPLGMKVRGYTIVQETVRGK